MRKFSLSVNGVEEIPDTFVNPKDMVFCNKHKTPEAELMKFMNRYLLADSVPPIRVIKVKRKQHIRFQVVDGARRVQAFRKAQKVNPTLKKMPVVYAEGTK